MEKPVEEFLNKIDEMIEAEMAEEDEGDEYDAGIIEGYKGGLRTAKDLFMETFTIIEVDSD